MRNTIIGIVIGVVVGVMIGATVVAPRLEEARHQGPSASVPGAEVLGLNADSTAQTTPLSAPSTLPAPTKRFRIISLYPAKTPVLG